MNDPERAIAIIAIRSLIIDKSNNTIKEDFKLIHGKNYMK